MREWKMSNTSIVEIRSKERVHAAAVDGDDAAGGQARGASVVEVEIEGEGPGSRGCPVDGEKAARGQATGAQKSSSAADDSHVAYGVGLAKLAEDVDGANVVALRDVGSEDVEESEAHLTVELPEAVGHADLLRASGGPAGERVLEGGGGAEGKGIGPSHIGRKAIDRGEVVGIVHSRVVDDVLQVEGEGAGSAQRGRPLPA
ncbi:hypothetical protein L7F22_033692 [Adiantum nelumboides]|nr:hypothetical protein [Adiantum nelumboides]